MKRTIKTNILTGLIVLLPISLFLLVVVWLYRIITNVIAPFTNYYGLSEPITILLVSVIFLLVLFLVGVSVRTKPGTWVMTNLERYVFNILPGYKMIKQILEPFIGNNFKKSFKSVALVDIWDNDTLMTAFVTDKTEKYITVFVPTGPNPTSGNIYHVPTARVKFINAKVDVVLRSVISVGAGSKKLINKLDND